MLASGWFDLVDYEQLSNIAKMHEINMSGLVDQSTAVQLGKFAGAQFMVVGNVTGLTSKESGLDYQHGRSGGLGVDVRTKELIEFAQLHNLKFITIKALKEYRKAHNC